MRLSSFLSSPGRTVTSSSRILIFGHDSVLLETRSLVLLHSGFDVTVSLDLQKTADLLATRSFDLFILCHSLPVKDCESAWRWRIPWTQA